MIKLKQTNLSQIFTSKVLIFIRCGYIYFKYTEKIIYLYFCLNSFIQIDFIYYIKLKQFLLYFSTLYILLNYLSFLKPSLLTISDCIICFFKFTRFENWDIKSIKENH